MFVATSKIRRSEEDHELLGDDYLGRFAVLRRRSTVRLLGRGAPAMSILALFSLIVICLFLGALIGDKLCRCSPEREQEPK